MADKKDWQKAEPSEKQLNFLKFLGYKDEPPKTAGEASKLINKLVSLNTIRKIRMEAFQDLSTEEVKAITDRTKKELDRILLQYCIVTERCFELGIDEGQTQGMLCNQLERTVTRSE
jgi:hypothetical protein